MNLKLKRTIPEINYKGEESVAYKILDSLYPQKPIRVYSAYYKAAAMLKVACLNKQYNSPCRFFLETIWSK